MNLAVPSITTSTTEPMRNGSRPTYLEMVRAALGKDSPEPRAQEQNNEGALAEQRFLSPYKITCTGINKYLTPVIKPSIEGVIGKS